MTRADWVVIAFVALSGLLGLRRGLIAGALAAAGVVAGAVLGARLAPQLLSGGARSPYTPLAALAGAAVLAALLQGIGGTAGAAVRRRLLFRPLRALDSLGGFLFGAATALAIVWVIGAVALHLPGQTELREGAQRSLVLRRLNEALPPRGLLNTLARIDPFPAIAGPLGPVEPPDPRLVRDPAVRRAAESVVRVLGTACGVGMVGTGWVAAPGIVVTAAHVVAGQDDTTVRPEGSTSTLPARALAFDTRNDLAVLRVEGLRGPSLELVEPRPGTSVAILGYPGNRSLSVTPGRIGQTTSVIAPDVDGGGRVFRTITTVRGRVRQGNSGGPAIDGDGRVQTTLFAARPGSDSGYGVPTNVVRRALARAKRPVSTGDCVR